MDGTFTMKRGLENIYCAEVLKDNADEFETDTPFHLIPAGELSASPDSEKTNYPFDNTIMFTVGREGATEVKITGAGMRAPQIAVITGKDVDAATGAVLDSGEPANEKYFSLGAEMNNLDGTSSLFWFAKGTFSLPEENGKTEGEDTDASGTELTYSAIKTIHKFTNGKVHKRTVIDTETTQVKSNKSWFDQVVTPDNIGTICEKVVASTNVGD